MVEFLAKKCIRQGEPLTPFLFLVVAKGLSGLVREVENKDLIVGISVGEWWFKASTPSICR